ncbi:MAG: hypothetical protein V4739_07030 [Pseudomonadota bacterium]
MAIERVVAHSPAGPMLAGLDWRPPSQGRHTTRALHEAKNQTEATHFALLEAQGLTRYGLYKPRPAEEMTKLPKGALSAAACFASLVGPLAPNAALVLPVESGDEREEQKFLVVVLDEGVPHIDAVVNEMAARDTIGSEERPMWAHNDAKYPNCELVDYDWLATGVFKGARLAPIPINPWPVVALASLVAIGLVSWWGYQNARKAEEARLQARLAAQADPVPKYLAALSLHTQSMATRRTDVVDSLQDLFRGQVRVPGWQLTAVECTAHSQQCASSWTRKGGTFDDLKAALPSHTLVPVTVQGSEVPVLDQATTVEPWPVTREGLLNVGPDGTPSLPNGDRALTDLAPLLQVWRTAGLAVELKGTALWPSVPQVPADLRHPSAVRRGQIEVGGIPGPFIQEVLETAPPWVQWEKLRVELGDGDMRSRLNFKVSGNYYVSSN